MKMHTTQFLGPDSEFTSFENAAVAILPFPYEGGVSYGKGTANAPEAVLNASHYLELYDEVLKIEPHRIGITTVMPPPIPDDPETMIETVCNTIKSLMDSGIFVVLLGGDHSITNGYFRALHEKYGSLSVIQLDAHADLRDSYNGSKYSHACTMSRIRDISTQTLQVGIRSLSKEEAERIEKENIALCTMHDYRQNTFDIDTALDQLPGPVFLTFDVDVFDWSVIASTGTPEPGGFLWDEAMTLLNNIFIRKNIVGFDVVELAYRKDDKNSPFAVAKLIYKMLGFKLTKEIKEGNITLPLSPRPGLFH